MSITRPAILRSFLTVLIALTVLAGLGSAQEQKAEKKPPAPDPEGIVFEASGKSRLRFRKMQGKKPRKLVCQQWYPSGSFDFEKARGKVVMVVLWGSWCKPCQRTMPLVKKWAEEYADRGLVVVGIHSTRDADKAQAYLEEHGITFKTGVDFKDSTHKRYHAKNLPGFYFVDRKGVLRFADVSNHKERYLVEAIELLLGEGEGEAESTKDEAPR